MIGLTRKSVIVIPLIICWIILPTKVAIGFTLLLVCVEIGLIILVNLLRSRFPWLITERDLSPNLSPEGLQKFFKHSYDPELGWVRKPHTSGEESSRFGKTSYNINEFGSRCNPGHEHLPSEISFYGDSFTFGRQVNDNESAIWHLSEKMNNHILNFAVGNYGLDQALLRLQKEFANHPTRMVIIGVVPSTIVRILSVWKHYDEYGNTFGFKPRYVIEGDSLKLVPNFIDNKDKFAHYTDYIEEIKSYDPFFSTKFQKDIFTFPYLGSLLTNPLRHISLISLVIWDWLTHSNDSPKTPYPMPMSVIMKYNLKLRVNLFRHDLDATALLGSLIKSFKELSKLKGFRPVLLWTPQKDDVEFIRKHGNYYDSFITEMRSVLSVIDLTEGLITQDELNYFYCDDNQYGGHMSPEGNKWMCDYIYNSLSDAGHLSKTS
ncbi:hypothetical protein BVX99_02105 [bacterium F16]|nr:hypothetical protein BVX99_02105 [bacterium F16]